MFRSRVTVPSSLGFSIKPQIGSQQMTTMATRAGTAARVIQKLKYAKTTISTTGSIEERMW